MTLGKRIRMIRRYRGYTQAELGEKVGLSGDRIQKYENGVRKPKCETLNKIANALDVDIKALIDPNFNDPISVMYALFELDRIYGVDLKCVDGSIALSFLTNEINEYIKVWEEKKRQVRLALTNTTNDEEKMNVLVDYEIWKWEFSKMYSKKQNIALICDIKNREKQEKS